MRLIRSKLLLALAFASGAAHATCDSTLAAYAAAVGANDALVAGQLVSETPECFGASPQGAQVQINGTSFQQAGAISRALGLRFASDNPGPWADASLKGMAAGNAGKKWNVWGDLGNNDTRQRYVNAFSTITLIDSKVLNTVIGADFPWSPSTVVGVSLGLDRGDTDGRDPGLTYFNSVSTRGYSIAPYVGIQLSKALFLDASMGLGRGKFTTNQGTDGKSTRWYAAANLGYERWTGNYQLTGKASYLHGIEDYGTIRSLGVGVNGSAAKSTLGQLRLSAQVAYWANGIMPFASLGYMSDVERKSTQFGTFANPIGRDAWTWSLGVNFISLSSGLTGSIAYRQEESRGNQENRSLTANIGLRF